MTIPSFTIDGVLPPFVGSDPGASSNLMSPYEAKPIDVVLRFGTSDVRRTILRGWLAHRAELRAIGFDRGFQWLDGSFTEDKVPGDLDVLTFLYRPAALTSGAAVVGVMNANPRLFRRHDAKQAFKLDIFQTDLDGSVEGVLEMSRYILGLFSHRRNDFLWKGIVKVRLENPLDDAFAGGALGPEPATAASPLTLPLSPTGSIP